MKRALMIVLWMLKMCASAVVVLILGGYILLEPIDAPMPTNNFVHAQSGVEALN
jgi:hypothetical protein